MKINNTLSPQASENDATTRSERVERAERVKKLKNMMNMSLAELAEKHSDLLVFNTLRGWESPSAKNPLSSKGAHRLVQVAHREGIKCTYEWLYYGIGVNPTLVEKLSSPLAPSTLNHPTYSLPNEEEKQILKEAALFKEQHPHAVVITIEDDGMTPQFNVGERVGGIRRFHDQIKTLIGLNCIVETEEGEVLLRRLLASNQNDTYTLCCLNLQTTKNRAALTNIKLKSAAQVIWHRCKAQHN